MELREGKEDYFSRYLADQAVDQRNNRIGRSIGSAKPDSDMKTLAASIFVLLQQSRLVDGFRSEQPLAHQTGKTFRRPVCRGIEKYRQIGSKRHDRTGT